jgi:hypothetical protein
MNNVIIKRPVRDLLELKISFWSDKDNCTLTKDGFKANWRLGYYRGLFEIYKKYPYESDFIELLQKQLKCYKLMVVRINNIKIANSGPVKSASQQFCEQKFVPEKISAMEEIIACHNKK